MKDRIFSALIIGGTAGIVFALLIGQAIEGAMGDILKASKNCAENIFK